MSLLHRLARGLRLAWRIAFGVFLTQFLPGAFLLSGWGQELMRRAVLHRLSREFDSNPVTVAPRWPSLFLGENPPGPESKARIRRWFLHFFGGAWRNLSLAVRVGLATYTVSLPGISLMAFSWRYGWDNSFNKGYEQAYIGPTLGWAGAFLFMLAMLYIPLAQAQLAAGGKLRHFFRWRLILAIMRSFAVSTLLLPVLYFFASLPINVLLMSVLFRFNELQGMELLSDREFRRLLDNHFLFAGLIGLPFFVLVRLMTARLYAAGFVRALSQGNLSIEDCADMPDLYAIAQQLQPVQPSRTITSKLRRAFWVPVLGVALTLWFPFVAQIYIKQFLNYVPIVGWFNQPLVHTPWLRYIPPHLRDSALEAEFPEESISTAGANHPGP